jgi:hypothetical protein
LEFGECGLELQGNEEDKDLWHCYIGTINNTAVYPDYTKENRTFRGIVDGHDQPEKLRSKF